MKNNKPVRQEPKKQNQPKPRIKYESKIKFMSEEMTDFFRSKCINGFVE